MRKLVIDCGNSLIKLGIFEGKELTSVLTIPYDGHSGLQAFLEAGTFDAAILASVVELEPGLEKKFTKTTGNFLHLSPAIKLPFNASYATPETLGTDRLALVAGAVFSYPQNDCLIINTGSCVTYNYVKASAEFIGGAISPGLQMRLKAMNTFTAKLPMVQPTANVPVIATTTEENLQSGALYGLVYEIQGFIDQYLKKSEKLKIILTGGDCQLISGKLKNNGIFADANLALKGLNLILDYNVEK